MLKSANLIEKILDAFKKSLKDSINNFDELGDSEYTDLGEMWTVTFQPIADSNGNSWTPEPLTILLEYEDTENNKEIDSDDINLGKEDNDVNKEDIKYVDMQIEYDGKLKEFNQVYCKDVYNVARKYMLDTYGIDLDKVPTTKNHKKFEVASSKSYITLCKTTKNSEFEVVLSSIQCDPSCMENIYNNVDTVLQCDEFLESLPEGENTVCILDNEDNICADIVDENVQITFMPLIADTLKFIRYTYAMMSSLDKTSQYYNNVVTSCKYIIQDIFDCLFNLECYTTNYIVDIFSEFVPNICELNFMEINIESYNCRISNLLYNMKLFMCNVPEEYIQRYERCLEELANIQSVVNSMK